MLQDAMLVLSFLADTRSNESALNLCFAMPNILFLQVLYQVHYKLSTLSYRGDINVGIVHLDGQLSHRTSNKHHHHDGSILMLQRHGYGE